MNDKVVPNCDMLVTLSEWQKFSNCCTLECCARNVESNQDNVRRYEAILKISTGSQCGQRFQLFASHGPAAETGNGRLAYLSELNDAQNLSLSMALLHLNHCGTVIKPRSDASCGAVTQATQDLLQYPHPRQDISLADQRARLWSAFAAELAHGVLRARKTDMGFDERLQADFERYAVAQAKGNAVHGQMLIGLILMTLPDAAKLVFQPVPPPPMPVLTEEQQKTLTRNMALAIDPRLEITRTLLKDNIKKYRAFFVSEDTEDTTSSNEEPPSVLTQTSSRY